VRTRPRHEEVGHWPCAEGAVDPLHGLDHRSEEVELWGPCARSTDRFPHDEAVHPARAELGVGAAVEQVRRRCVAHEVQRRLHTAVGIHGGDDLTRIAFAAGLVEPVGQCVVERRGQALPLEDHPVDPQHVVEAHVRADLDAVAGAPNPAADVATDLRPELVRVREVAEPVGVADRGLEAGPVEGQPVRDGGGETASVGVVGRQLLDQLAHELALDPELCRVLPRRRSQPRSDEPGQRRLGEHGEPELALAQVGQPRDDVTLPLDDDLAPIARCDGVQPPALLERRMRGNGIVVARHRLAHRVYAAHLSTSDLLLGTRAVAPGGWFHEPKVHSPVPRFAPHALRDWCATPEQFVRAEAVDVDITRSRGWSFV